MIYLFIHFRFKLTHDRIIIRCEIGDERNPNLTLILKSPFNMNKSRCLDNLLFSGCTYKNQNIFIKTQHVIKLPDKVLYIKYYVILGWVVRENSRIIMFSLISLSAYFSATCSINILITMRDRASFYSMIRFVNLMNDCFTLNHISR